MFRSYSSQQDFLYTYLGFICMIFLNTFAYPDNKIPGYS